MARIHKREKLVPGTHITIIEFINLCELELPFELQIVRVGTTLTQQLELYAKGRTTKGEPPYTEAKPLGQVVTFVNTVKRSAHARLAAVDVVPVVNGELKWGTKLHADLTRWYAIGALAERITDGRGQPVYKWGGRFNRRDPLTGKRELMFDAGHVEFAGWEDITVPDFAHV